MVKTTATRRYRVDGGEFDPAAYGAKIRALIDEHITALGIEQKLPPIALTAPTSQRRSRRFGPRAKAPEMEHAIRHHITVHGGEDPARYQRLSERLEQILEELKNDWDQQVLALQGLLTELAEDRPRNPHGLSPVENALYGVLLSELATSADGAQDTALVEVATGMYQKARTAVHRRDFWSRGKETDQEDFRRDIFQLMFQRRLGDIGHLDKVASRLLDVVRSNSGRIPPV